MIIKFSELDKSEKQMIWDFAEEVGTLTSILMASVRHIGELWAAKAFINYLDNPESEQHQGVCLWLRRGKNDDDYSIYDLLREIAPDFDAIGSDFNAQLDALIAEPARASEVA